MLKPPAYFCCYFLSLIFLNGCSDENDKPKTDPLKGHETKFLKSEQVKSSSEPVFYSLERKDNKLEEVRAAASDVALENGDQDSVKDQMPPTGTLSPEVLEAIKRNGEIRKQKEEALKTLEEARKLEQEILKVNRSDSDGYIYSDQ